MAGPPLTWQSCFSQWPNKLSLYKPQVHLADLLFLSNQCPVCNTIANVLSTVGHSKVDPHLHQSQFGPFYLVLGQPQLGACRNANLSNQVSMICEVLKCFSKRLAEYNSNRPGPSRVPIKVQFKQSLGGSSWTE